MQLRPPNLQFATVQGDHSLIQKFGGKEEGEESGDIAGYIEEMKKALPPGFTAKGDLYVSLMNVTEPSLASCTRR